ncbi:formate dehydrogenase accessory sulfurtransferase FdhD [Candidatus Bathyarchaeota archaeon]|nr:MAG: formate dehydrogenase accessory sulfurtransferase FdhD [Candidatus Bathyarchaeota archaeon]
MSTFVHVEKIDMQSNTRKMIGEPVVVEVPVNIFVNNKFVTTLFALPKLKRELALGWLFDEGILQSLDEIKEVVVNQSNVNVITKGPIKEEALQAVGVAACGSSINKFLMTISKAVEQPVESSYKVKAYDIIRFVKELDRSKLYRLTRGVHVAAIFESGKLVAFAEDIGRHNAVDKVIGISIESRVNFSNSVLVSSGRQPADMVLKTARMKIPIVVSIAAPIYSGIIAAEKTGVTLVCHAKSHQIRVYTHPYRILL